MNKFAISLLGAAGLFVGTANAAPLTNGTPMIGNGVESVRMVCNEYGRCWRERGERVIIQRDRNPYNSYNSYDYAPRERYIERGYHRHDGPGIGVQGPGFSFGIGGGDRW